MLRYSAELGQDDNGTIRVIFPDLPEAATFGEDREEALMRAVDAIGTAMQGRITDREEVPLPSGRGVDRLFQLRHASRLDQLEAAFAALGKRIDVQVSEAG